MAVAGVKAYLKARPHIQVTLQLALLAMSAITQSESRSGLQASCLR